MAAPEPRFSRFGLVCLCLLLPGTGLSGQQSGSLDITPAAATMLVGDSRPFRLINHDGKAQQDVAWSISDPGAFDVQAGDEIVLTAKRSGDFRLNAGGAEATIKVIDGTSMPAGTQLWSAPSGKGCKTQQIIQATPSADGPDIYQVSQCEDGQYIQALTSNGIVLWRRKMGEGPGATDQSPAVSSRLSSRQPSICDSITVGQSQTTIREQLRQHMLSAPGDSTQTMWIIDEPGAQCRLWFDQKSVLSKKRKILVSD